MAKNKPDPEIVAIALEAVGGGASAADVAAAAGVSASCVRKWCKAAGVVPRTRTPKALAAARAAKDTASEPPELPTLSDNSLERARAMQAELYANANEAKAVGNYSAAQRSMRDAVGLAPIIARLEKAESGDADVLRVSRAEIDAAMASHRSKTAALLARPLLCAHCGRALSLEWASKDAGLEADAPNQATEPTAG